jgi:hypothetical protein
MPQFTDGYAPVEPAGRPPLSAPGTEKTNEAQPKPGPEWAKRDGGGGRSSESSATGY